MTAGSYLQTCAFAEVIDLVKRDNLKYRGLSPENGFPWIFGGQLIAQSLRAAISSCDNHLPHSIQTLFVSAGNPHEPIDYKVQLLRTSKSLTFLTVDAVQSERVVTHSIVTLGRDELGLAHQPAMPSVIPAAALPHERERVNAKNRDVPPEQHEILHAWFPFEVRPVNEAEVKTKQPPAQECWLKLKHALDGSPEANACALAYASDFGMIDTVLFAHEKAFNLAGLSPGQSTDPALRYATLTHNICFHQQCNAEGWLLHSFVSPIAANGRGFTRAEMYEADRQRLVASVSQEAMYRLRDSSQPHSKSENEHSRKELRR